MAVHATLRASSYISQVPIFQFRGVSASSPYFSNNDDYDVIDELFYVYRANVIHKQFNPDSDEDKFMSFLILFVSKLIQEINLNKYNKVQSKTYLNKLESNITNELNTVYSGQTYSKEIEIYIKQIKTAIVERFIELVYEKDEIDKFWAQFGYFHFAGKKL
ncbi:ARP2_3 complex 21 kDa subunit [Hexamita inflata]|uniref:ARP2 3 complex 21 kDa subunit n=1 Tax=Hexamita inflata TaxID=28002 RepID=A0AA86UI85_9EUKA|nr:ARP2 3 complex 21 kDa subunit [Hexamita inflata]